MESFAETLRGPLYELLTSPSESKFCDLHHYTSVGVRDVHGAALSSCSILAAVCLSLRVFWEPRSSRTLRKFCIYQIVNMTLATFNHLSAMKFLNDFVLDSWAVLILTPTTLQLYDENEEGGAWYFSNIMPREVYKYARWMVPLTVCDPRFTPIAMFLFTVLPSQPRHQSMTSGIANAFIVLSLFTILYELVNEGVCPNHFPVHALSDACIMFYMIHLNMHLQDIDLGVHTGMHLFGNATLSGEEAKKEAKTGKMGGVKTGT